MTSEGQCLYNGLLKPEGETTNDEDPNEPKNLYAFLIQNDLIKRKARKRGDPIEAMPTRRDFGTRNRGHSTDIPILKSKPLSKIKEIQ
mmetsp:Transcript_32101/g.39808  ORF Transcript_32101/g.39808 Transcript_32101/m.39808 type:complete len:88 (-) Transcript_32101:18-281(-)